MYHVLMLVLCLSARGLAGYNQFFYSGYSAPVQQVHYQPLQQYQTPVAYQSFVPQQHYVPQVQAYSAFPAFPTTHGFGYHQSFPQQFVYHTSNAAQGLEVTTPGPSASTSSSSTATASTPAPAKEEPTPSTTPTPEYDEVEDDTVITNAAFRASNPAPAQPSTASAQPDGFRGFAYRNEFEGGRSHFVFITGPEAYRMSHQQDERPLASRTSASDAVDSVGSSAASTNDHSLDALIQYLEHPQVGVQRFYSVNNALVSRRVEEEIPAASAHQFANVRTALPIAQPISPLFPILRSSFQLDAEAVKPAEKQAKEENKEEQVGSASSIETKSVAPETSAESTTTTTPAPSTTVAATTEAEKVSTTAAATTSTTEAAESSTAEEKSTMGTIVVE